MQVKTEIYINAPIDKVFDVFADIKNAESRIEGISKIEILSEVKSGVGTRWRETRVIFGKEATEEMEISKLEKNKMYEVVAASNGAEYRTIFDFKEVNGGTKVEMIFEGKPVSLMAKLMTPLGFLFKGMTKKLLQKDMDDLKEFIEAKK